MGQSCRQESNSKPSRMTVRPWEQKPYSDNSFAGVRTCSLRCGDQPSNNSTAYGLLRFWDIRLSFDPKV